MRKFVLVVMLAACGDDGARHTPDATPHDGRVVDGAADAAPDAAPQPVTITTSRSGTPVMGVHVYFQNADSTVVLATTTDATGTASAVMAAGGYVTAINPYTPPAFGGVSDQLYTFDGVKPGDHLQLALDIANTAIQVTVQALSDPAANSQAVYTPCGVASLTGPLTLVGTPVSAQLSLTNCGASTDFLVVSEDQFGLALNSFFVPNVAISNGATIDLTGNTYAGVTSRTYAITNPAMYSLQIDDSLGDAQGLVWHGITYDDGSGASQPVPAFSGASDIVVTTFTGSGADQQELVDWAPYSSTFTTDLGARMLREFESAPMLDTTTHTVSITEGTTGVVPDFVLVETFGSRQSPTFRNWYWQIAAPHATSVTYPTLPTDVYDFNLGPNDTPQVSQFVAAQVPGGYDAVRPYVLSGYGLSPAQYAVGPTGSAVIEQHTNPAFARTGGVKMAGHAVSPSRSYLGRRVR